MKYLALIACLACSAAVAEIPYKLLDVDVNWQQLQKLPTLEAQEGADFRLVVRPKVDGSWLTLTGVTATWAARATMTSTNYYGASSAWTTNSTHKIAIDLDSGETGTALTNWVYVVSLISGGNTYPIGTGRYDVVASTFTGAGTLIDGTNTWATKAWVQGQGYLTTATAGDITAVTAGTGLSGGGTNGAVTLALSAASTTSLARAETAYGWGNHASAGYRTTDSNAVVAAGTGGITVSVATNGTVRTYTVSDDDAGGSGTTDHAALSNLAWTASGHTGTPARIAGFFEGGAAGLAGFGAGLYLDDDDNIAASNVVIQGAAAGLVAQGWGDHSTNGYLTAFTELDPVFGLWLAAPELPYTAITNAPWLSAVAVSTGLTGDGTPGNPLVSVASGTTDHQSLTNRPGDSAGYHLSSNHTARLAALFTGYWNDDPTGGDVWLDSIHDEDGVERIAILDGYMNDHFANPSINWENRELSTASGVQFAWANGPRFSSLTTNGFLQTSGSTGKVSVVAATNMVSAIGAQPTNANLTAWALLNPATVTTNDLPGIDFGTGGGTLQDAVTAQGGTPVTNVPALTLVGTTIGGPALTFAVPGTTPTSITPGAGSSVVWPVDLTCDMFIGSSLRIVGSQDIDEIESTLTDNTNAVPTSAAVVDYAQPASTNLTTLAAGTATPILGTTATKAAAGDHVHAGYVATNDAAYLAALTNAQFAAQNGITIVGRTLNIGTNLLGGTGGGGTVAGQLYISASGLWPSAVNGCAESAKLSLTTNGVNLYQSAFDPTSVEYAEIGFAMPSDWDAGTVTATLYWAHPTTTVNFGVVWGVQARAFANAGALDQAYGTAQEVTDTGAAASTLYISPATAAITIGGSPAASQYVQFRVYREATDGADTLAVDAYLIGVMVSFTRN